MEQFPPLRHLYVNPAGDCNLSCAHCWITPDRSASMFDVRAPAQREITPDDLHRLIVEALPLGLLSVKFTGGEPLLRSDFAELYAAAGETVSTIILETNGTLEPPGIWDALRSALPRSVAVSLDSVEPGIHDAFRRTPGAWNRSRGFIDKLVSMGIETQVIMSVIGGDADPVVRMAMLCREMRVSSLKINPVQPIGRGRELSGSEPDIGGIIDLARRVHARLGRAVTVDVPPAFIPLDRLKGHTLCPVLNLLGILPDGGVSFCGIGFSFPSMVMGNATTESLAGIWKNSPTLALLREQVPRKIEGICSECIHLESCMGKCVMQNMASGGSFTSPHWFCTAAAEQGLFPASRLAP